MTRPAAQAWSEVGILDLVTIASGQVDPRLAAFRTLPLIAPDHIESGSGRLLSVETAAEQGAISGKYLVQPGDVIYSKIRPNLRKAHLARFRALCSADMYPLRPKSGVSPEFILSTLLSETFTAFAVSTSMRSGIPKINRAELAEYQLLAPPGDEQRAIGRALRDADSLTDSLEELIVKKRDIKQGMMQQLLTGATRLAGFSGDWSVRRLGDLLSYEQPGRYLVASTEYVEAGGVPVLTAGKTFILGYSTETTGIFDSLPVIIFDDFTTASRYVTFPFKAKSSAMKMLHAKQGVILRYIFERMQLIDFQVADHKRRWIAEFSKIEVEVPELDEQQAITSVIEDADAEIRALERRLESARAIKVGMMQELLTGRTRLPIQGAA